MVLNYLRKHGIFGWNWKHIITHPWIICTESYYRTKWFFQRGWRGYSDCDNWSIDGFLMSILPEMLQNLRKNSIGCPVDSTPEEWSIILKEIEEGFRANQKLMNLEYDWRNKTEEGYLKAQSDRAFDLFVKHFNSLWD